MPLARFLVVFVDLTVHQKWAEVVAQSTGMPPPDCRPLSSRKGRRPLQAPNRLIAEFNMGCYGYADSANQRVPLGAHVKISD